jgi:hypothetical protein
VTTAQAMIVGAVPRGRLRFLCTPGSCGTFETQAAKNSISLHSIQEKSRIRLSDEGYPHCQFLVD